jgi:hypothetical protein
MTQELIKKVSSIQSALKAPKNQHNKFGNYSYRSCEDILEAVKPLLKQHELVLTISDSIEAIGGRVYVKAVATITDGSHELFNTAFARESEDKKGMDSSQVTGSTSSYARKYALNGLFLIDDTKDADATNTHGKEEGTVTQKTTVIPTPKAEFKQEPIPVVSSTKTKFVKPSSVIKADDAIEY